MAILGSSSVTGVTTASATSEVINRDYIDHRNPLPILSGNSGRYLTTNGIGVSYLSISNSQEFTSTGAQTFVVPPQANIFYIECVGSGSGGNGGTAANGGIGGGAGSYTAWYIHRIYVLSNMTVTVGVGGAGGASGGGVGTIGQPTTVSWTGPGSITHTLTSYGGGLSGVGATNQALFVGITTVVSGLTSATSASFLTSSGTNGGVESAVGTAQTGKLQPTGGGGGGAVGVNGGAGGTLTYYGNTVSTTGGTSGSPNGSSATAITSLPYGNGGAGGYGNAGNGGNGAGNSGGNSIGANGAGGIVIISYQYQ